MNFVATIVINFDFVDFVIINYIIDFINIIIDWSYLFIVIKLIKVAIITTPALIAIGLIIIIFIIINVAIIKVNA